MHIESVRGRRTLRLGAVFASVAALLFLAAGPAAAAAGANSSAYGVSVTKLLGLLTIAPTPQSTFPPGSTESAVPLNLGALGNVGVLTAITNGDSSKGISSATGKAANVALLAAVPSLPAISADAVEATCSDTAPADPTGSTTLTNAKLSGTTAIDLSPAANTKLVNLPGLAVVILNEQTLTGAGVLTVNAIHIILGTNGALGDVVIGQAVCGPNTAAPGTPAFSFGQLPLIVGGIALIVVAGIGVRAGARRLRATV